MTTFLTTKYPLDMKRCEFILFYAFKNVREKNHWPGRRKMTLDVVGWSSNYHFYRAINHDFFRRLQPVRWSLYCHFTPRDYVEIVVCAEPFSLPILSWSCASWWFLFLGLFSFPFSYLRACLYIYLSLCLSVSISLPIYLSVHCSSIHLSTPTYSARALTHKHAHARTHAHISHPGVM